ncbi:MAG: hypothetical protein ACLRPU_05030 [Enterococcus hulanensis]
MGVVRGSLRKGIYISKKSEKVYLASIQKDNEIILAGKKGKGAKRFDSIDDAYLFLDQNNLRKKYKVIRVR